MTRGDRQLRRLLVSAISAHKNDDPKLARKFLDAAIEHVTKTAPTVQQQQQIQPNKKR